MSVMPYAAEKLLVDAWADRLNGIRPGAIIGLVKGARRAGWEQQEIADVIGVSRQTIVKWQGRHVQPMPFPAKGDDGALSVPTTGERAAKLDSALVHRLRALQQEARSTRGSHPPNHPARKAGDELWAEVAELSKEHGYTVMAHALGISPQGVRQSLARRGYIPLPKSQAERAYVGGANSIAAGLVRLGEELRAHPGQPLPYPDPHGPRKEGALANLAWRINSGRHNHFGGEEYVAEIKDGRVYVTWTESK